MLDFDKLAKEHARLFPKADFVSQVMEFDDEYTEYKESTTDEHALKELADCTISLIGVYRFAPDIAKIMYTGLKSLCIPVLEERLIVEENVLRKWEINKGRTWIFDEKTKKYHHAGKDGEE